MMDLTDDENPTNGNNMDNGEGPPFASLPSSSTISANECDVCGKKFSKQSNVTRHKKTAHASETLLADPKKGFECRVCKRTFSAVTNRRRHEKSQHNYYPDYKQNLKCSEVFHRNEDIFLHFQDCHPDINMCIEEKSFDSFDSFSAWKLQVEKETASYFVKKLSYERGDTHIEIFTCHRSGMFASESKGMRHMKVAGSHKTGYFCPSNIQASILSNNNVSVRFLKTRVGHKCEVGHLALSGEEKNEIAGMMHAGVPFKRIMNNIAKNASPTKRLATTTMQDLRNISKSYGLDISCCRSDKDLFSVHSWVQEMRSQENDPILCYKLPGETSELYNIDTQDFLLGFMNEAQEEIFKIYGNEIVCIDSTHGTNKYDIQLTSLLVKDDNCEGFPVAFLWSNRQNEITYKIFFENIKKRIGDLSIKTFISDDYPAFYNAWLSVFPPAQFYLICNWHVKRAWRRNLNVGQYKVQDMEKKKKIILDLDSLANEIDIFTFEELSKIRLSQWMEDPETSPFANYFKMHYLNRPQQWAACYRIGANINTNMVTERWHKDLKYNSDLNGKCGGRLVTFEPVAYCNSYFCIRRYEGQTTL